MIAMLPWAAAARACSCGDHDGTRMGTPNGAEVPPNAVFHVFYEGSTIGLDEPDIRLFDQRGQTYQLVVWPEWIFAPPHAVQVRVSRFADRRRREPLAAAGDRPPSDPRAAAPLSAPSAS